MLHPSMSSNRAWSNCRRRRANERRFPLWEYKEACFQGARHHQSPQLTLSELHSNWQRPHTVRLWRRGDQAWTNKYAAAIAGRCCMQSSKIPFARPKSPLTPIHHSYSSRRSTRPNQPIDRSNARVKLNRDANVVITTTEHQSHKA